MGVSELDIIYLCNTKIVSIELINFVEFEHKIGADERARLTGQWGYTVQGCQLRAGQAGYRGAGRCPLGRC